MKKILYLGKLDEKTCQSLKEFDVEVFAEDSTQLRKGFDFLITDRKRAGLLPQPFEQEFSFVILLSAPDESELRVFEKISDNKYKTHIERFKCENVPTTVISFKENFLLGFARGISSDPDDVRRAVKLGNKFGMHCLQIES